MSEANTCRLMCVLTVVCVAALATGVSPALGAFPGENGKIVFDSDRDGGDSDVWTMSPDGSNPVNLTANSAADDWRASWRADGRKIVFMSDRETPSNPTPPGFPGPDFEIFVMNADGSNPTQITFNDRDDEDPAWSPDGREIVFRTDFDPCAGRTTRTSSRCGPTARASATSRTRQASWTSIPTGHPTATGSPS